ncbi:MAG: helix-turn-helix domain-containing protein [Solirubrobacterales bacterium]|nr:helix-turn-helix domain-containing protein [Solirubrobacterales bacterium]
MATVRESPRAALIAEALEARREELIGVGLEEIKARLPAYGRPDPALLEDVRRHIGEHHDLLCTVLRRGRPAAARQFEFAGAHAALRARRGIALADFLEAFRSYHNVVWDAVLDASEQSGEAAQQALAAARTVIRHIDLATTQASAAYLEAQQLLLADSDRVRRDVLEDLLAGKPPGTAAGLAAARAAGLERDARFVVIAALPTDAPEDEGVLRVAANTLAAAIAGRTAPLAVARHGEIVVARALAAGERPSLLAPLQKACSRMASRGLMLAVGVSTIQDGVAALGEAYREASLALGRIVATGGVLSLPDMSTFEYLMLRDDAVARRLIAPKIERFVAEDREQGGLLTRTLLAYAEADLNAKAAAETLLIHVNTAHYRLARIAEKTGCDLRRLSDVLDLLIAVKLTEHQAGR